MNFFSRNRTDPASVLASIENRLNEARSQLVALELRHGEVALAAELSGDNGKQLDQLNSEIAAQRSKIANLESAYAHAEKEKAASDKLAAEAEWQANFAKFKDKLNARAKPADRLRKALFEAVLQFRELQRLSAEAQMLEPNGKLVSGCFYDPHDLQNLVGEELARLWDKPAIAETTRFPGSTRMGQVYDEREIKPLIESILDANSHAIRMAQA
jgi:hypothetical protein